MKPGVMLAIAVSVVLIGGASVLRFRQNTPAANLIAVEKAEFPEEYYQDVFSNLTETGGSTTTPLTQKELTSTDIISQQLVLDYIQLASSGGVGEASLEALAERYVESIPTLTSAPTMSYGDLKIVSGTRANLENYVGETNKIYRAYKTKLEEAGVEEGNINSLGTTLYSSAALLSQTYADTAAKLAVLPIPSFVVEAHLGLVNSFLSNAEATKALSEGEQDSAKAFAGLITLNENMAKEQEYAHKIDEILSANGI